MKCPLIVGVTGVLLACGLSAQMVVPASPRKMAARPIGGNSSVGVTITPTDTAEQKVRYTTHVVLADSRQWTSTDGKTLQAKWIAFEDLVVESTQGAAKPTPPVPPANPTLVRDGKIRLIGTQKPFELALDRLSQADRDFVEQYRAAHPPKAEVPPP
ncbi:MAG: hypothetical protein WCO57_11115 [Verrucomicrobiota bacterium]